MLRVGEALGRYGLTFMNTTYVHGNPNDSVSAQRMFFATEVEFTFYCSSKASQTRSSGLEAALSGDYICSKATDQAAGPKAQRLPWSRWP